MVIGRAGVGKGVDTGMIAPTTGVYQGNNSSAWSTTSDRRIKKNIVDNNNGLEGIKQLQVRNFEYKLPEEIGEGLAAQDAVNKEGVQLGVIAQEIEDIFPDVVVEQSSGCKSVNPDNMTWYLVNAVKELSNRNAELAARVTALE